MRPNDFASYLLAIGICNLLLYFAFYIIMKVSERGLSCFSCGQSGAPRGWEPFCPWVYDSEVWEWLESLVCTLQSHLLSKCSATKLCPSLSPQDL